MKEKNITYAKRGRSEVEEKKMKYIKKKKQIKIKQRYEKRGKYFILHSYSGYIVVFLFLIFFFYFTFCFLLKGNKFAFTVLNFVKKTKILSASFHFDFEARNGNKFEVNYLKVSFRNMPAF